MKEKLTMFFILSVVRGQFNLDEIECPFPEGTPADYEEACRKYSACVWAPTNKKCHMDNNEVAGYIVSSGMEPTERGFMVHLQKFDPGRTMFNADILELVLEVVHHEDYHLQIKIYDPSKPRYEVPIPLNLPDSPGTAPLYNVTVSEEGSALSFSIKRISTGTTIFNTVGPLSFEDQFIQLTTSLASTYFYGLGEVTHETFRREFGWRITTPMFSRDQPHDEYEFNEFGVHPYYVNVEDDDGNTHSVLFYNSNAMEFSTFTLTDGPAALTFKTIGGIIDLHFFLGPTPESVNVQYSEAIGTSVLPPYWSLGFHLSRYGYNNLDRLREVRQRMKDAGIPQDGQMCDLDYMDANKDFTYSLENFGGLPEFIDELHEDGVKLTLILEAIIDFDNPSYSSGVENDVFVKWMDDSLVPEDQEAGSNNYIVGYSHQYNKTVFPDFFNPETREWWSSECQEFHEELMFDGLWINSNIPNNLATNQRRPPNYPYYLDDWSLKCPYNSYDEPPFPTVASYHKDNICKRISDNTICMSGSHNDGNKTYVHYDVHSIYGHSSTIATYKTLESIYPGKRPFVLTASTFPGSGSYAAYYLGVNFPTWEQMAQSIIDILNFNLFIVPFVGADICGYFGRSEEILCARWMQLGAFYPFSRNHNNVDTSAQDPANPDWPLVNSVSRDVLLLRYKYLPYLYLLLHKANVHGGSVVRPLFNVFPTDIGARDIEDQFFWGDGIMIAPVLNNETARDVYFPQALWYEIVNGTLASSGIEFIEVDAPMEVIPVYVKGGVILPFQEPDVTTYVSRNNSFGLTVALDEDQYAAGEIFWDDGESVFSKETTFMSSLEFVNNTLTETIKHGEDIVMDLNFGTVQFYGYPTEPSSVTVNGEELDEMMWDFDLETNVLILDVDVPMSDELEVHIIPL